MINANNINVQNEDFFSTQRRTATILARQMNEDPEGFTVRNKSGVTEQGEQGDYLVVDEKGFRSVVPKDEFDKKFVAVVDSPDKRVTFETENILPIHFDERVLQVAGVEFGKIDSTELMRLDKGNTLSMQDLIEADEMPQIIYLRLARKENNTEYSCGAFQLVKRGKLDRLVGEGRTVLAAHRATVRKQFNPQPDPPGPGPTDFEIVDPVGDTLDPEPMEK